jgi:hypothetical protein
MIRRGCEPSIRNLDNDTKVHLNKLVDIAVIWDTNAATLHSGGLFFRGMFDGIKAFRSWPLIESDVMRPMRAGASGASPTGDPFKHSLC